MLAVGNCSYVVVCSAAQSASAPTGGGEGRGHTVAAARLQLVVLTSLSFQTVDIRNGVLHWSMGTAVRPDFGYSIPVWRETKINQMSLFQAVSP